MKLWQKTAAILGVGAFPATLALFSEGVPSTLKDLFSKSMSPVATSHVTAPLEESVQLKVQELAGVDVRIIAARGELMKFEDQKRAMLDELEALRTKIGDLIARATASEPVSAQNP